MTDPVELVVGLVNANNVKKAELLSAALSTIMNRRNANIFWRALIDKAAVLSEKHAEAHTLDMMKLFVRHRLDLNMPLDNGDFPINVIVDRSHKLALLALNNLNFDLNVLDKSGLTPSMRALAAAKSQSIPSFDIVLKMMSAKGFKPEVGDQAAHLCFKGLAWLQIAAGVGGGLPAVKASITHLVNELASKNYDFNAARETPDSKYGSTINTPLAYCIKKAVQWLEWSQARKEGVQMGEAVWFTAQSLMLQGADPCLQIEAGDRVQLLELCRSGGFPPGMMQSLEMQLLSQSISNPLPLTVRAVRRL